MFSDNITLECHNVQLFRNNKPLLTNVSFAAQAGDVVAILGPNGVGKSTLLQVFCGLYKDFQGIVKISSAHVASLSYPEFKKRVAWLPQTSYRPENMTVLDVVSLATLYERCQKGRDTLLASEKRFFLEVLREFDAETLVDREATTLSGGEWMRVCLARVRAQRTPLLCLDEPTTALDLLHVKRLAESLRRWAHEEKRLVVLSTHDIIFAQTVATHYLFCFNNQSLFVSKDEANALLLEQVFSLRFVKDSLENLFIPIY